MEADGPRAAAAQQQQHSLGMWCQAQRVLEKFVRPHVPSARPRSRKHGLLIAADAAQGFVDRPQWTEWSTPGAAAEATNASAERGEIRI